MSRRESKITEHDLHAYADGALADPKRQEVEAHLAADPAAAEEVEAWRRQNEALRALYGHVAAEPVPPRLSARRIEHAFRARTMHWTRLAAAAVLLVAAGATGGWLARDFWGPAPVQATLVAEALEAHRVYAAEVRHPVEVWADEADHLQAWLSKRLDRTITVPDLRPDGLTLVGGRLLPASSGPAAQFMYEDETGRRVTLYITPSRSEGETAFRYARLERLDAFFWSDEGISCAMVGDLPRDRLREITARAYEQLV